MNREKAIKYYYFAVTFVVVFLIGMVAGIYLGSEAVKQSLREDKNHRKASCYLTMRGVEVLHPRSVTFGRLIEGKTMR